MKEYVVSLYSTGVISVVEADNEEEARKKGYEDMLKSALPEYLALGHIQVDEVVDELPKGWKIDKGAQTSPRGYVWIYNGKGFFSGREFKLMRVK